MQTTRQLFIHRRTPRRKLVFSSSDDETEHSPQSISSVHILRQEHQDEQLFTRIEYSDITVPKSTRSKLEHYGFQQLARPVSSLRQNKRPTGIVESKTKKIRGIDITPTAIKPSRHPMQTRSQSSTDSHSDQLIKLFDKTLSTVTPNRDDNKENEIIDETISTRSRVRRLRPLPLCLSDNENKLPVLTIIPINEDHLNTNKRIHDDEDDDEDNSDLGRSIKRTKFVDETNKENQLIINRPSMTKRSRRGISFVRSLTEPNEEQIKASVELGTNRDLIGDRSRTYLLPRCKSRKHPDLACISPETLINVLENQYSSDIEQVHIIDCRYPYEYEGGHIQTAKNIYTRKQIFEEYFRQPIQLKDPSKRNLIIFHCEFSSERAPSLLRYFRSEDRTIHEHIYPQLHYPEIYLLEGGYKAFFEYSKEYSIPKQYRPMVDVNFQDAYREYRFEAKQHEKFTGIKENKTNVGGGRRTRISTYRSCLSFSSQSNTYRSSNPRYDLRYTGSPSDY